MENEERTQTKKGLILALSGPSGCGKTTIAHALLARAEDLVRCVTATTRPPRAGERNGVEYHFVNEERFEEMGRRGEFLEESKIYGHRYGTPRAAVERLLAEGKDVLLILDVVGREQVVRLVGSDVLSIFLLPPDAVELERRLRGRALDDERVIAERLRQADEEIALASTYDHVLVNVCAEGAANLLHELLLDARAERVRCRSLASSA